MERMILCWHKLMTWSLLKLVENFRNVVFGEARARSGKDGVRAQYCFVMLMRGCLVITHTQILHKDGKGNVFTRVCPFTGGLPLVSGPKSFFGWYPMISGPRSFWGYPWTAPRDIPWPASGQDRGNPRDRCEAWVVCLLCSLRRAFLLN